MKIILLRHGDKLKEAGDIALSERGRKEAWLTAQHLSNTYAVSRILSGTQRRAVQTAQIISEHLNLMLTTDQRLNERINFGDVSGQSYQDYLLLCKKSVLDRNYVLPNGETSILAGKRISAVIQNVMATLTNTVVLVSHGGVIGDYLRNIYPEHQLKILSPFFVKYYIVPCCSITELEIQDGKVKALTIGSVAHLGINSYT